MSSAPDERFAGSYIKRAWEPPEEAVLIRAVVETVGLQPEDLGVLAALLLMDPRLPATAKALAAGLREFGWKMSLDRFEKVAARLTKAGHMSRESVFNQETKRPEWVCQVYRNPANNRPYVIQGVTASSQVGAEIGENPSPGGQGLSEVGENPISPGQSEVGENPISGKPRVRKHGVSAGQNRNRENPESGFHPPHPPEEVDTSSPYPLNRTSGLVPGQGSAAPTEEEVDASHQELANAEQFLMTLPGEWRCGRKSAKTMAPILVVAAREQGWELDDVLVAELTKNPGGIRRFTSVLSGRIEDLPLRGGADRSSGPRPALPAWCGKCNYGEEPDSPAQRRRELPEGQVVPCPECHPRSRRLTTAPEVPAPAGPVAPASAPQGIQQLLNGLRKPAV